MKKTRLFRITILLFFLRLSVIFQTSNATAAPRPNTLTMWSDIQEAEIIGLKNIYNVKVWLDDPFKVGTARDRIYRRISTALVNHGIALNTPIPYSIEMVKNSRTFEVKSSESTQNSLETSKEDFTDREKTSGAMKKAE